MQLQPLGALARGVPEAPVPAKQLPTLGPAVRAGPASQVWLENMGWGSRSAPWDSGE